MSTAEITFTHGGTEFVATDETDADSTGVSYHPVGDAFNCHYAVAGTDIGDAAIDAIERAALANVSAADLLAAIAVDQRGLEAAAANGDDDLARTINAARLINLVREVNTRDYERRCDHHDCCCDQYTITERGCE